MGAPSCWPLLRSLTSSLRRYHSRLAPQALRDRRQARSRRPARSRATCSSVAELWCSTARSGSSSSAGALCFCSSRTPFSLTFECSQPANTRIGAKRIHTVRVRGGNTKHRALRLDTGNFAWASEHATKKTRIIGVVYNASNNELVRTNTLVKNAIVQIDAAPFRQWYEAHYNVPVTKKGKQVRAQRFGLSGMPPRTPAQTLVVGDDAAKKSGSTQRKLAERQKTAKIDPLLESQFQAGRLYAAIASRPGQSGRADGYILEGAELNFYVRRCVTSNLRRTQRVLTRFDQFARAEGQQTRLILPCIGCPFPRAL